MTSSFDISDSSGLSRWWRPVDITWPWTLSKMVECVSSSPLYFHAYQFFFLIWCILVSQFRGPLTAIIQYCMSCIFVCVQRSASFSGRSIGIMTTLSARENWARSCAVWAWMCRRPMYNRSSRSWTKTVSSSENFFLNSQGTRRHRCCQNIQIVIVVQSQWKWLNDICITEILVS